MEIKAYLQQEADNWATLGHPALMQRFVLAKGKVFAGRALPKSIKRGVEKQCFMNAYRLAMDKGYRYIEGYACRPAMPLLIHHAWVVDKLGRVIDPTWNNPQDAQYMGVEFSNWELEEETSKSGVYGILDTGMGLNADLMFNKMPELKEAVAEAKVKYRQFLEMMEKAEAGNADN